MANDILTSRAAAVEDFRRARRRAAMQTLAARLTGRSIDLDSYEEIASRLRSLQNGPRRLREIPLERIVGSVGRYREFTRTFLPRSDAHEQRWAGVKTAMTGLRGVPPIEVYQIGEDYYVHDGNHRVSVARDMGLEVIEAYVTAVGGPVAGDRDECILRSEQGEFQRRTGLAQTRPGADLELTAPGKYPMLLEHIDVHRHYMGLEQQREISYEEAAAHWYDRVFRPVADVIDDQGIVHDFPGRTVADLYLWISRHRADLAEQLGWRIGTESAAQDLTARFGADNDGSSARAGREHNGTAQRVARLPAPRRRPDGDRQFNDILVAVSGTPTGWQALDQALLLAIREHAQIAGLHLLDGRDAAETESLAQRFHGACEAAGVRGSLATEAGPTVETIRARAVLADLVVIGMTHPPGGGPLSRLGSAHAALLRHSVRPVLLVPCDAAPPDRALVACDGGDKSREALYLGAYAALGWGTRLRVVIVGSARKNRDQTLSEARAYLDDHGVEAQFVTARGNPAHAIGTEAADHGSNLVLMGGYRMGPALQVMLGGTVNPVLRATTRPVLVCT